jgi:hypothetical protein
LRDEYWPPDADPIAFRRGDKNKKQDADPIAFRETNKKQGAAGITTAAPHIAGQWGRGDNRLPGRRTGPKVVPASAKIFATRLSDGPH